MIPMKKRLALIFGLLFLGVGIIPVYAALNSLTMNENSSLEVGYSVLIKGLDMVVEMFSITESSRGTTYIVSGVPDTYPPFPDVYRADELVRIEAFERFRGLHDLMGFIRQLEGILGM